MHLAKKDLKYEAVWICEEVDHCTWRITDSFMGIWEIMWFIISSAFTNFVIWQDRHLLVTVYLKIDFRGAVFACWSCSFSVEERDFIRVSSVMNMWWRITGANRHNNKIFFFLFFLLRLKMEGMVTCTTMVSVYVCPCMALWSFQTLVEKVS